MTTQIFGQSRNPVNTFNSRISPPFCFEIPNPSLQVREIPEPEKPIGDSAYITWGVGCSQSPIFSWDYWGIARVTVNFPNVPRGRASGIKARGGASSQTAPAPQVVLTLMQRMAARNARSRRSYGKTENCEQSTWVETKENDGIWNSHLSLLAL